MAKWFVILINAFLNTDFKWNYLDLEDLDVEEDEDLNQLLIWEQIKKTYSKTLHKQPATFTCTCTYRLQTSHWTLHSAHSTPLDYTACCTFITYHCKQPKVVWVVYQELYCKSIRNTKNVFLNTEFKWKYLGLEELDVEEDEDLNQLLIWKQIKKIYFKMHH